MAKKAKKLNNKNDSSDKNSECFFCKLGRIWEKHHDLIAVGVIFIILLVFYSPVMFSNKTLLPPDTIASKSFQPFVKQSFSQGAYPLWNPYIFSGMPSFASLSRAPYMDLTSDVINAVIWIFKLVLPLTDFTRLLLNYLLFGSLLFLLLRKKELDPVPALFSAIALLLMPQIVAYAAFGHTTKLATAALIPLVFLLVERLLKEQNILYFSLTALAVGFQLLRFHVQINFYSAFLCIIYFIYWAVLSIMDKEKIWRIIKGGALLGAAFFMGLVVSSVVNLSVWEYSHYSIRGGAGGLDFGYATNWSFPPAEILTFFNPSFMGFGRETYWGAMPFTDFPMYFGSIVLLLAGTAVVLKRNRTTDFFLIIALIALFISFGKHFPILYGPMFKLFPLFNKFRAPKMIHILLQISMVLLAGFGLQAVLQFDGKDEKKLKRVKNYLFIFAGVTGGIFLFILIGKGLYLGWAAKARAGADQAYSLALADGLKELLYVSLAVIFIVQTLRQKMNKRILPVLLIAIVVVDFWTLDRRFIEPKPVADQKAYFADTGEVAYLKQQKGYFRILPVADNRTPNWYMYHLIESAYGYQGAKLKVYQRLMDAFQMPNQFLPKYLKRVSGGYAWKNENELNRDMVHLHKTFLQLTNVRYLVTPYGIPDSGLKLVYRPRRQGLNAVLEFTDYLPRAYFPEKIIPAKGDDVILKYITSPGFDAKTMAVVNGKPEVEIMPAESDSAEILEKSNHRILVSTKTAGNNLLILSEIFYPAGWKAYVDNDPVKIERVNFALRGVYVPAGKHTVEFVFKPQSFKRGLWASILSFTVLLAGVVVGTVQKRKKNRA